MKTLLLVLCPSPLHGDMVLSLDDSKISAGWGWRDGSSLKSTCCSCGEHEFGSPLPVTPDPGYLTPLASEGTCTECVYTHVHACACACACTYTHVIKNNYNES